MSEKTGPIIPGTFSEGAPKHSLRTRITGARSRIRRVHLIAGGSVLAVLLVGAATWAAVGGGPSGSGAAAAGPDGTAASPNAALTPQGTDPAAAATGEATASPAAGFPVPTFSPGSGPGRPGGDKRPSSGQNRQAAGMPTDLSATRDGDTLVLQWKDNTNNEDGFAIFVTQGWTTFQINVPAGTTRYAGVTAARNTRTCFAVVPFTWTDPMVAYPTGGWECTDSRRP
jgi:hypothetical protein